MSPRQTPEQKFKAAVRKLIDTDTVVRALADLTRSENKAVALQACDTLLTMWFQSRRKNK